ncbi:MAG: isocitrate/isopropylmalate dehydrogenase family protein [Methanomassiliicoccales archaeon]|jgi:3-isopropylmalate dehydrogenase|nr:isocitrate/isopropylmalate dehydrogenase family protein [Methanomassiliicoccales archaeon]
MFRIAVIPGDGIGPEVIGEGLKVMRVLEETGSLKLDTVQLDIGATRYLQTGKTLTDEDLDILVKQDAIYFGAVGDPRVKPGILERGIILAMRSYFDQYINLRPVRSWINQGRLKLTRPFNIVFLRENTEDFYLGAGGVISKKSQNISIVVKRSLYKLDLNLAASCPGDDDFAFEIGLLSRRGVRRFAEYAIDYAKSRGETKITVVDKANVCTALYGLWREVFDSVAEEKGIDIEYMYVDAMSQALVRNPEKFHVVATPNMFGDILTDLGAEIQGSLGLAASGNINPKGVSMFEPVHGSAPDIAGRGIANPIGAILAAKLMLEHFGCWNMARRVEEAVERTMEEGIVTPDLGGRSRTKEVGDAIVNYLMKH